MDPIHIIILAVAGLAGGFIAGLIGVGGGIIFAPVLFFYFSAIGIPDPVVTPLTLGSSLMCTTVAALSSAYRQIRHKSVHYRTAINVGLFSGLFILLVTSFVTTQPWYDGRAFQIVFGSVLLVVVVRTVWPKRVSVENEIRPNQDRMTWPYFAGIGGVTGSVASAAGVGGGVIMVPAYYHILKMPMHATIGTSSASIVLVSVLGVLSYVMNGWQVPVPGLTLGYVDIGHSLVLSIPAVVSAQFGVKVAHRSKTKVLKWAFAVFALLVAGRMIIRALIG